MLHVFFIDPLEKLLLEKDSTLWLAMSLKKRGHRAFLFFEKDFLLTNKAQKKLRVFDFEAEEENLGPKKVWLKRAKEISLEGIDLFHMRLDPPFDSRYLRYLWMLLEWKRQYGLSIINAPEGLLLHNEKIAAFQDAKALPSWVSSSVSKLDDFVLQCQREGAQGIVLKPLDLYQGLGVEKMSFDHPSFLEVVRKRFQEKVEETGGPLIVQPFCEKVVEGEVRSLFFAGHYLGSILKVPASGQFLSNLVQGASYRPHSLCESKKEQCVQWSEAMNREGLPWVAFDILDESIQEVNLTCPGLLVEMGRALKKNLALDIIALLEAPQAWSRGKAKQRPQ